MDKNVKRFENFGYAFILVFLAVFLLARFQQSFPGISSGTYQLIATILFILLFVIFCFLAFFTLKYVVYNIDMFILSIPAQKIENQTFYCQNCKVRVDLEDEYCENCGILL